jgi:hypothetical protein
VRITSLLRLTGGRPALGLYVFHGRLLNTNSHSVSPRVFIVMKETPGERSALNVECSTFSVQRSGLSVQGSDVGVFCGSLLRGSLPYTSADDADDADYAENTMKA